MNQQDTTYDVIVIGAGFAGMAAALFAANRGLKVIQTGSTGGIDFSTGFLDLMCVHPISEGKRWKNPWNAIDALIASQPSHPYAMMPKMDIAKAFDEFTDFLKAQGLEYTGHEDRNTCALTPAGTVKRTYRIPKTAWHGAQALETKAPTLLVDFKGLKGFSANQILETQRHRWPALKVARVEFPGGTGELYPEHMAWSLADPAIRQKLVESIKPHLDGIEYIGFPAILGLTDPSKVVAHLSELTGKHVFEVPTLPPSIAGPRLRAAFDRGLPELGVTPLSQKMVHQMGVMPDGTFLFDVGSGAATTMVKAKAAILATGRFFGKGLRAERKEIVEPIFHLSVTQPEKRNMWHRENFFDAQGHPLNTCGIEVDEKMRPLGNSGQVAYDNLYAAGAILAHQDWMRSKSGAGLAIATAFKAVKELLNAR